jgi:hypothetical protein
MLSCRSDLGSAPGASDVESDSADPGVRVRRRISFESANLIGSPQDDGKSTSKSKVKIESELLR